MRESTLQPRDENLTENKGQIVPKDWTHQQILCWQNLNSDFSDDSGGEK